MLVTLLKMRSHYSQSSRENATPSTGTAPIASCKGVAPPPPPRALKPSTLAPGNLYYSLPFNLDNQEIFGLYKIITRQPEFRMLRA